MSDFQSKIDDFQLRQNFKMIHRLYRELRVTSKDLGGANRERELRRVIEFMVEIKKGRKIKARPLLPASKLLGGRDTVEGEEGLSVPGTGRNQNRERKPRRFSNKKNSQARGPSASLVNG